jgi:predicted DNA binding protein
MMRAARLLLRIPGNWVSEVSQKCHASVKVMKCVPWAGETGRSLVKIEALDGVDHDELVRTIKDVDPGCDVNITSTGPGTHIATVTNHACDVCGLLNESDCFLDSAVSQSDGKVAWTVIGPTAENISSLVERLRRAGCEVEVTALREKSEDRVLTFHQEKVLRIAYELGYYDIPRATNLEDFAAKVGVSKSTLDLILRRAERRLIAEHINTP